MFRLSITLIIFCVLSAIRAEGREQRAVVADSLSHMPLPNAALFDRQGRALGVSGNGGEMPEISPDKYPVTVRFLGFREKVVDSAGADTIFLAENPAELPEVLVESRSHKVLHVLSYVREYSTLSTYTDTVFLFREKMVDFMLNNDSRVKFKGWSNPRVLTSKSYYRFTDSQGLDSVSDVSRHHFSWSDWMGLPPVIDMPAGVADLECGTDTLRGKYSPYEIWVKNGSKMAVDVNVLADAASGRWVPGLSVFFRHNLDFEKFKIKYVYDNASGRSVSPLDLGGYSYNIESNGRGHSMFFFNRRDEPFFVSTYAEVYILDKEYIPVKEAKKWEKRRFDIDAVGIMEAADAPELPASVLALIDRVNNLDRDKVRVDIIPDHRLVSKKDSRKNFRIGHRALAVLKQLTGITQYKTRRNLNKHWDDVKQSRREANKSRVLPADDAQSR